MRRRTWSVSVDDGGNETSLRSNRPTDDQHRDVDLLAAIAQLSVQQRCVVFFVYWEDMTEAQVADTLGLSRGTVHRNLRRARNALREAMT